MKHHSASSGNGSCLLSPVSCLLFETSFLFLSETLLERLPETFPSIAALYHRKRFQSTDSGGKISKKYALCDMSTILMFLFYALCTSIWILIPFLPPPRRILSQPSCVYGDDAASHSPSTYVCIAKDPCLRGYPKQVAHFPASCPSAVSMFTGSGLTNLPHPRCIAFRPARPYGEKPNKPSTSTSHALPPDPSLRGITMQD